MAYDFFVGTNKTEKNVFDYRLDDYREVDTSLIDYAEIMQISPEMKILKAIAVDSKDNIYLAGKNKVFIYNNKGNLISNINTGADAQSIAVGENNNIYVGAKDHLEIWDATGNKKATWKVLNPKVLITSIAIADSSVYVADAGNKIVYHYDLHGNIRNEIGRKDSVAGIQGFIIPSPYFDVAIGHNGEIWVVNSGRHQLESYDKKGRLLSSWEKTSMGLEGFSGCCNPSHIAILPNGSFVTSEKGIERVKVHDPTGKFSSVVVSPKNFDKGTRGIDLALDSENRIIVLDPQKGLIRIFEKK